VQALKSSLADLMNINEIPQSLSPPSDVASERPQTPGQQYVANAGEIIQLGNSLKRLFESMKTVRFWLSWLDIFK